MTRSVSLTSLVAGQRMNREVKKDKVGNGGFLRETAVGGPVSMLLQAGEEESEDSKREGPGMSNHLI